MTRSRIFVGFFLLTELLFLPAAQAQVKLVPLPHIEDGTVRLRVAHAINPRMPKANKHEIQAMLKAMQETVFKHFQVKVLLEDTVEVDVNRLLAKIPPPVIQISKRDIFDFKSGAGNQNKLVKGYLEALNSYNLKITDMIEYVQPYLINPVRVQSKKSIAQARVETHLGRLGNWKTISALDGQSIVDATIANEWKAWDVLGYSQLPYDLVITNQPIISAEYKDVGINTALRGGVTAGTTGHSKSARYNTYSMISTFPFIEYAKLPKGTSDISTRAQAIKLAGQYTAHEIGHMLLLLAHPYGNSACVMQPEPMFNFAAWAQRLDANKCKIGSSGAMTPGAAEVGYHPDW